MSPEVDHARTGLGLALERLRNELRDADGRRYLVPFSESLHWLYSLHEWYRQRDGKTQFFGSCGNDQAGRTLVAIVWARGAVTHGLVDVTKLVTTSALPAPLPMVLSGGTVRWLRRGQLPPQNQVDKSGHGRDSFYDTFVADEELLSPLDVAYQFLLAYDN